MEKVKFNQMKDGTKEDYLFLDKHEKNFASKTADRIIKQVKQQGMPKEIVANLEKLKKDTDDLTKSIERYNKKAKRLGQKPIKR